MLPDLTFTTDPTLWTAAALAVGAVFGIVLVAIGFMHAFVRPRLG